MKSSEFVKQSVHDGTTRYDMRIAYFGRIVMRGNSYCIVVPKEIRNIIETKRGDLVRIEIEKVKIENE